MKIETLMAATTAAQRKKPKSAKAVSPPAGVERYYRTQLRSLVRAMARDIDSELMPIIKAQRAEYTQDAVYTADDWARSVIEAIARVRDRFLSTSLTEAYRRIAEVFVNRTTEATTAAMVNSVNRAVGVDIKPMLSERAMDDFIQASIAENVGLIRSIPEQYFGSVESAVLGGMKNGERPSGIATAIQAASGVSKRRANLISRDQLAKITGQVVEKRQTQAGINHYRSIDSNDERVSGRPSGKYPNARISCWGIARKDVGYGPGVYTWKEGATWAGEGGLHPGRHHVNCRCTSSAVFEWELP